MPIADLRPARLDVRYRPGDVAVLRFDGPAGWLTSRTFTAVLSNTSLVVTEETDTLVVTASEAITTAVGGVGASASWALSVSGGNEVIVGTWAPSTDGTTSEVMDFAVSLDGIDVELTAPFGIEARLDALEAIDVSDGGDADTWE